MEILKFSANLFRGVLAYPKDSAVHLWRYADTYQYAGVHGRPNHLPFRNKK